MIHTLFWLTGALCWAMTALIVAFMTFCAWQDKRAAEKKRAAKHADVDALAKRANAYVRGQRIWSNIPDAPPDEHAEHLGAA